MTHRTRVPFRVGHITYNVQIQWSNLWDFKYNKTIMVYNSFKLWDYFPQNVLVHYFYYVQYNGKKIFTTNIHVCNTHFQFNYNHAWFTDLICSWRRSPRRRRRDVRAQARVRRMRTRVPRALRTHSVQLRASWLRTPHCQRAQSGESAPLPSPPLPWPAHCQGRYHGVFLNIPWRLIIGGTGGYVNTVRSVDWRLLLLCVWYVRKTRVRHLNR